MKKNIFLLALLCFCWMISAHADDLDLPEIESEIDAEYAPEPVASAPAAATGEAIVPKMPESQVLESAPINVDGYVKEDLPQDNELAEIQKEIQRQKTETALNKQKVKGFQELSKSVEVLSETTVGMLEEKKEAQAQIAEYNTKVKCLQQENPGPECDKYVRRKR